MKVSIRFSIHFQIHRSKAKPVNEIILFLWFQPTKQTEVSLMWYYTSQETSLDNLCNMCCFFTFPLLTYKMFRSTVSLVWLASNSMQLKASLYRAVVHQVKINTHVAQNWKLTVSAVVEAITIHGHGTTLKFDTPCSRMKRWLCITTKYCRLT